MDVISSIPSLFNFQREGISGDGLMKRYAILFDHVIFNRYGAPIGDFGIESLAEVVALLISTGESIAKRRSLGANKRFQDIFVDCWDVVRDAERFESMKYKVIPEEAQKRISEFCFSEVRRQKGLPANSYAFDIDDVKELSGDLYSDIGLNILAKAEGLDIVPSYSPIIGRALENEIVHRKALIRERNNEYVADVLNFLFKTADRDRTVFQRSEPSSCTTFISEQLNPWNRLQLQDVISRHRGAKPRRRYELLGAISLLSLAYLLSVERWQFHIKPPDHLDLLSYLLDL